MQFGAMNFPIRPIGEELAAFAALGFDYLELAMDPPMAHYSVVRRQSEDLRRALARHGMGLVCHMPTFLSTADLTESLRRASLGEVLLSLECAAEMGASKVVLHPGRVSGMGLHMVDVVRRYAMEALQAIAAEAQRLALPLCLENMFPGYGAFFEPEEFEVLFRTLPSLQLTCDIAHAHIGTRREARPLAFLKRFAARIGHLHLSDNSGRGDEHLPLGKGSLRLKRIAEALAAIGYDDTLTLEIFDPDRRLLAAGRDKFAALLAAARG
jgi:sugar phosphate isomerase/epimerase